MAVSLRIVLAFLLIASPCAYAGEDFHYTQSAVRFIHYPVSGQTFDDLVADSSRRGYLTREGTRFPGYTRYSYRYAYRFRHELQDSMLVIRLTRFWVGWEHAIYLPKHEGPPLPPAEAKRWRRYLQDLEAHERIHLGVTSDPRLELWFRSLYHRYRTIHRPWSGRSVSEGQVKDIVNQALGDETARLERHLNQKNLEFDLMTDHGTKRAEFDRTRFFGTLFDGL